MWFAKMRSPFGFSTDFKEYLPLILVCCVATATIWLWFKIKRTSGNSDPSDAPKPSM